MTVTEDAGRGEGAGTRSVREDGGGAGPSAEQARQRRRETSVL